MATSPYLGGTVGIQQAVASLNHRVTRLENSASAMPDGLVGLFEVTPAAALDGAQISLSLTSTVGVAHASILRAFSLDASSAVVLATYPAAALAGGKTATYSDNDPALAGQLAYYWLQVGPLNPALQPQLTGPQTLSAAASDQVPPDALLYFDGSVSAGPDGASVTVGVSFAPPNETRFGAARIYVEGYNGNPNAVAIGQFSIDPDNLVLQKTGETVTLLGVSVNKAGKAAAIGTALTKKITLGNPTAPCMVLNGTATGITGGVQIGFSAGPEASITSYIVSRGPLGGGFAAAAQIGTVAPTGAAAYNFLDTTGLTGQYEWYVQAVNPVGTSAAPPAITLQAVTSSANLPANAPFNNMNNATVDSIDGGTSATVRVYGPGGVGTGWTRATGYGSEALPAGTLAGLNYTTVYYVLWNGEAYFATTSFVTALADNNIWVGTVKTCAAGGTGGTTGGGGSSYNQPGGRLDPTTV